MKKISIVIFLLVGSMTQAQWTTINNNNNQWFRTSFGADQNENIGYVSSNSYFWPFYTDKGKLFINLSKIHPTSIASTFWGTTNGGQTWSNLNCGIPSNNYDCIQSFHFAKDGIFGLAVTFDGIVKKTFDGAQTWTQDNNPLGSNCYLMDCWTDGIVGIIVGCRTDFWWNVMQPIILTNSNIKVNSVWKVYTSPETIGSRLLVSTTGTFDVNNNSYVIYALDVLGTIYQNLDNSLQNWSFNDLPGLKMGSEVVNIKISDCKPDIAYCVGYLIDNNGLATGSIYKTVDRGITWVNIPAVWPISPLQVNRIEFSGPKFNCSLYASGHWLDSNGYIFKSDDNGNTWKIDMNGSYNTPIYQVCFTQNSGYAVGNGLIAKLTGYPCGYSWTNRPVRQNNLSIVSNSQESDVIVYPNPTQGSVNINILNSANRDAPSTIVLYNYFGQIISTMDNVKSNKVYTFDLKNYPAGIYLVRISSEPNTIKKFIKID